MTVVTDRPRHQILLSFDDFLMQYGGDKRFELIDGEVFDLEPTGAHEQVAGFMTKKACVQIDSTDLPWVVLQRPLFRPPNTEMTSFRPDNDRYQIRQFRGSDSLVSPTFPGLNLTAAQVLNSGR